MADKFQEDEDYRRTILYRNAKAVGESVDAAHLNIANQEQEIAMTNERITMLELELRTLTQRFNQMFVKMVGTGATGGNID